MALEEKIIRTEEGLKNIKNDCPRCGSTDIRFNTMLGRLFCNHCKEIFIPKKLDEVETNLKNLDKKIIGSGIRDIDKNYDNIITLKCKCCGAEVTIDTSEKTYAKCHWCRTTLSINERIPNGTIPDAILPFSVTKEEAILEIKKFLSNKTKYMSQKFFKDLKFENVMGVYLPYILVDAKVHCIFKGMDQNSKTVLNEYDFKNKRVMTYNIKSEFDATIDDLTIESNTKNDGNVRTSNIINSIMPFDTKNCIKFESNYLIGYTCENRNLNIDNLEGKAKNQIKDIIRNNVNNNQLNSNVEWKYEDYDFKGSQIISAYLPVWIYSYHKKKGTKDIIHYIAVNGRTKEIMGSVPLNEKKLIKKFFLVENICIFFAILICYYINASIIPLILIFIFSMMPGFSFYYMTDEKYRNEFARHTYEKETKISITNSTNEWIKNENKIIDNKDNSSSIYNFIILTIMLYTVIILYFLFAIFYY